MRPGERQENERERKNLCPGLSSGSHLFKEAPGHPDPGVTVPQARRHPPPSPSICVCLAARWMLSSARPVSEQYSPKLMAEYDMFLLSGVPAGCCSFFFFSISFSLNCCLFSLSPHHNDICNAGNKTRLRGNREGTGGDVNLQM